MSSNWIILVEADVLEALNAAELTQYRTRVIANGQADPLPGVINTVTELVRGYIRKRFQISVAGLPKSLKGPALDIIVFRLMNRLGEGAKPSENRKDAKKEALETLKAVAEGDIGIEVPVDPTTEKTASGNSSQQVSGTKRLFTRHSTRGL